MNETDIAYLAGLMDADGWFSVIKTRRSEPTQNPSYAPCCGCCNTSPLLMEWLSANFEGYVRQMPQLKGAYGTKDRLEWRMRRYEMVKILPLILPHLVIKGEQVRCLLALIETYSTRYKGGRKGVPPKVIQERESLYQRCRSLHDTNHK